MTPEELQKKINEQNQVISSRYIEPTQADLESGIVRPAPTPVPSVSGLDATPPLKATPQEAETSTVISRVKDLNEALVGQSAYRATQETAQGIPELQKTQTDISAQLKAIQNEAQQIPLQLQQEATGRGITVGGLQPLQTARLRTNAIQALGVSSLLEASRGNLALATTLVDKAVAAKYDPIKEEIAAKTANLDLILKDPSTTLAEKNRAQAQKDAQDKLKTKADLEATNFENAQKETLKYAGVADALTLNEMSKAKTAIEVSQIAARKGITSLEQQKTQAETSKIVADANKAIADANGAGGMKPTDLIAYAQQYASTGQIPTGLPKGTFGVVSQFAKELPKVTGEIVDNNTNIKSGKLSSTQLDAYGALRDLTNKLDEAKTLFSRIGTGVIPGTIGSVLPSQDREAYNTLRSEIVDLLARARTGAAINATEEALYKSKIPGSFNRAFFLGTSGEAKLEGLKNSISGKLDAGLRANGVSMYGFSKVKLSDGKEYNVGDTITVNGVSGRILPDGSITLQ